VVRPIYWILQKFNLMPLQLRVVYGIHNWILFSFVADLSSCLSLPLPFVVAWLLNRLVVWVVHEKALGVLLELLTVGGLKHPLRVLVYHWSVVGSHRIVLLGTPHHVLIAASGFLAHHINTFTFLLDALFARLVIYGVRVVGGYDSSSSAFTLAWIAVWNLN